MSATDQILSVAQMRAAEDRLIAEGSSVDALMQIAGRGAADWIWRMAGRSRVTVLCGPGNNGGDGYVIAQAIRERGGDVAVIAVSEPATDACANARRLFGGKVLEADAARGGAVLVDCLFGSGLSRPLKADHAALLTDLAAMHDRTVAVDLPSGVDADTGEYLTDGLPAADLTIALGAWKFAHFLMPSSARMGRQVLVDIGVEPVDGAAKQIVRPVIASPAADAHKYRRGLLAVVGGTMPGAVILAARAAQGAGTGYVKLFAASANAAHAELVVDTGPLAQVLPDRRNSAVLIGPGLGRAGEAGERLAIALAQDAPTVIDADALMLLTPHHLANRHAPLIATPHDGELAALETAFGLDGQGPRTCRAFELAKASGMVIVAKGPDTVVAAPDGRLACARRASSWLSTAGTGDVLAGVIASRLATGADALTAACEGVWLHGEAARLCPPAFTAGQLADRVPAALARCL